MSRSSPFVITLSEADRAELQRRARCYTAPHAEVVRAKIVLLAADGLENTVIAERLDVHVGVVSRWRKRFAEEGMAGWRTGKRSGRPRVFAAAVVAEVKAMACEPPEDREVPQSRWSAADLAAQAAAEGLVESVARSTVGRWLDADAIRPWRYRSWIFPRDPHFEAKAGRVLDLYQRIWDGADLGEDEYVLSTDEKSQLQILSRCHPGLPPAPGRPGPGRVRIRAARHRGLPGRLRRAPGAPDGPGRAHHRDRPVHRPGEPGDDQPSRTPRPAGCSGSRTTAPPTAGRPPSTGWPRPGRTPSWCTCRCTHRGSTRSRSCSPSSSAK